MKWLASQIHLETCDRNSYDGKVHDNIFLWTWDNLDEENHKLIGDEKNKYNQTFKKVNIDEIIKVESILYFILQKIHL